jgi:hypothetical protein
VLCPEWLVDDHHKTKQARGFPCFCNTSREMIMENEMERERERDGEMVGTDV